VLFAELEVRHSRPFSPTRRVALGELWLPASGSPSGTNAGPGGLLLAGVVGAGMSALEGDEDVLEKVEALLEDLVAGRRVVQPRVLYRFQTDVHGLDRSRHRLLGGLGRLHLEIDGHGAPLPQVLASLYAAARLSAAVRPQAFRLLRRATRWTGGMDDTLLDYLLGDEATGFRRRRGEHERFDEHWALRVLGFPAGAEPGRSDIQRRFRDLVRTAHPDHGADHSGAGDRIVELTEARRILLQTA
jgi:hypothetical protein